MKKARIFVFLFALTWSAEASALVSELWRYLSRYQFGVDYTSSSDDLELSYETKRDAASTSSSCVSLENNLERQRCTTSIKAGSSSGFGVFLQQPFKKKGFFHLDYDVGFAIRYLQGELPESESGKDGLPLKSAKFSIAAIVAKPYIVVGVTPAKWPDILVSFGPALQLAGGNAAINGYRKNVLLGTGSGVSNSGLLRGFTQLEVVFYRFGDGAFSLFTARDYTGGVGTEFYPGEVDEMSKFRANFIRGVGGTALGLGVKLVFDWP